MKDTKKLNAGIAIICLRLMDTEEKLTEDDVAKVIALCERLVNTDLYKEDGKDQNKSCIQHSIKLIEEYLEEEGV